MKKNPSLVALSLAAAAALASFAALSPAQDAPMTGGYSMVRTFNIGGPGRWDYGYVDPASHQLYLTRSTHTQAIDLATGKVVFDVAGQKGSHGTAIVSKLGRGFITDGEAGNIVIFDTRTGEVLGTAAAAADADGIIYDSATDRVLAACGDAAQLGILDPSADPKSAKADMVDLGGKPEFLAADGKGMAYVNINDKNEIAVVDIKARKVTARYLIGSGTKPAGLAIDAEHGRLFIGCRNKKLIVMGTADGKVLAELPIGTGNDACSFDPGTGEAFASCGDSTLSVVKETSPGKFEVTQTVQTKPFARTVALDPTTHMLYLPTAQMLPKEPGERWPKAKPESFMVVVIGPKAMQ